ncbi:renal cancer differentiation gene 1 protein isoform X2 [Tamandua tetradactyla]|uniref:renal cancer differentiation gene 1 protein isoform X2 n=1 Tax=Tamandua tetradactyla TaxID=48850 RepID=UPI0040546C4C
MLLGHARNDEKERDSESQHSPGLRPARWFCPSYSPKLSEGRDAGWAGGAHKSHSTTRARYQALGGVVTRTASWDLCSPPELARSRTGCWRRSRGRPEAPLRHPPPSSQEFGVGLFRAGAAAEAWTPWRRSSCRSEIWPRSAYPAFIVAGTRLGTSKCNTFMSKVKETFD